MTTSKELTVTHGVGLHARPAALFVKQATGFKSKILVENRSRKTAQVNAKSILGILSIGVSKDDQILITAEGEDEDSALSALSQLIEDNFGEGN
jgi:phosphocarrier protein